MLIRALREEEHDLYNSVVTHPLQSWEWGEFRKKTGVSVERIGFFENGKLKRAAQVSFHPIPLINMAAGYFPKGELPTEDQLAAIKQLGQHHNALFIKLEPNVARPVSETGAPAPTEQFNALEKVLTQFDCTEGRSLFTKYTFQLDLTKSETELLANCHPKTRYNINVAIKKGVKIFENTSLEGMEQYLDVLAETTRRQGFYAHSPTYFRQMWETLGKSGLMHIFHAVYEDTILVSWIVFVFNGVLYYPYGASRSIHRDTMASNLMMWEIIRFGKAQGCTLFDMWGALGPKPDPTNPWFGFHRFKKGYGAQLVEFYGTQDMVLNFPQYKLFRIADDIRWALLRTKTALTTRLDQLISLLRNSSAPTAPTGTTSQTER